MESFENNRNNDVLKNNEQNETNNETPESLNTEIKNKLNSIKEISGENNKSINALQSVINKVNINENIDEKISDLKKINEGLEKINKKIDELSKKGQKITDNFLKSIYSRLEELEGNIEKNNADKQIDNL